MNLHPWDIPSDPGRTWLERRGGWVLSACFHVAVFGLLFLNMTPSPFDRPSLAEPIRVRLADATIEAQPPARWRELELTPTPLLYPEAPATIEPPPTSAAASSPPSEADDSAPAQSEAAPSAANPPAEPKVDEEAARMLAEHARMLGEANAEQAARGSSDLEHRLGMNQAEVQARKILFNDHEPVLGAIRQLDISDVDPTVAQRVLARYGMRFTFASGEQSTGAYGFLQSAQTEGDVYIQQAGFGQYRMFSYGPQATARMIELEQEEILRRGWEPDRVRVIQTLFGIVPTTHGFDLGVKRLKAEALPDPQPESTRP